MEFQMDYSLYCSDTGPALNQSIDGFIKRETFSTKYKLKDPQKNFTLISALGPRHCLLRPFGPKNECLDKVSLFGRGRLMDLQI